MQRQHAQAKLPSSVEAAKQVCVLAGA